MFLSLCYVVLRRVLQLVALRFRSNDLKRTGNRRASARTRHPPATNPLSGDDVDGPAFPHGCQPAAAARTLAVLHHHTGDAASLASALDRQQRRAGFGEGQARRRPVARVADRMGWLTWSDVFKVVLRAVVAAP